jgi:hypothetical protein
MALPLSARSPPAWGRVAALMLSFIASGRVSHRSFRSTLCIQQHTTRDGGYEKLEFPP